METAPAPITAPITAPLIDGTTKPRPVQLYECACCHKDIADEALPIAVRVAAFVVPKATRDRKLEVRRKDGSVGFDITDVGIPPLIRELVDAEQHPDGHVYVGLGCFCALLGLTPVNAAGEPAPIVPRAALDAMGIPNTAFTGREHRTPPVVELFDRNGIRVNADGSPVAPVEEPLAAPSPSL